MENLNWQRFGISKTNGKYSKDLESGNRSDIQNKLMVSYNFPSCFYVPKEADSGLDRDRVGYLYLNTVNKNCYFPYETMSYTELIDFAKEIIGEEISGARIVRFTNAWDESPNPRLDYFIKGKGTPLGDFSRLAVLDFDLL